MKVEAPGWFESAFAARLRSELDAIPVQSVGPWPVMRRARPIAFATAALVAIGAALIVGAVGVFAYGPWVQGAVQSFGGGFHHERHSTGDERSPEPSPEITPSVSASPVQTRQSPSPTPREHESPEPTDRAEPSGGESPEPRGGTASSARTSSPAPPPDE